jgi:hypothetical protein
VYDSTWDILYVEDDLTSMCDYLEQRRTNNELFMHILKNKSEITRDNKL